MDLLFEQTRERVDQWAEDLNVLGVMLVGSKSRGHGDELSDDDLEVILTEGAAAPIRPADCSDVLIVGEGTGRKMIYDAQYMGIDGLRAKESSVYDLDHWPYESSPILFDRDGLLANLVPRLAAMPADFRHKRLMHSTIDAWIPPYRMSKCLKRGQTAAARLLAARGARALIRLVFALEWRWVPLDHWLQKDMATLKDPARVVPLILEALETGEAKPLVDGLAALEEQLMAEGVPGPKGRGDLFMELIHPSNVVERAVHGLQ
ncbi:MAG: DUF4037 domain-containing protein [Chloroflexia bacterium]